MEELERESSEDVGSEVEPEGLQKLAGLMDESGNLPPHAERDDPPQVQKTESEAAPAEEAESKDDQAAEIEYDGEKFSVPAKLKDAFLRQADYTRKTQEVAQAKAAVEQERQVAQRLTQEAQQFVGQYAAIQQIDQQLAQLQKVDWQQLATADPLQNLQLRQSWTELVHMRQNALQQLEQARQSAQVQQFQAVQQAVQQGHEVLAKSIPNWGPDMQKALLATAQTIGYRPDELATLADPRAVKLLHKAYLYDQLQQQKTVAEKQVKQAPPKVVRPTASQGPERQRNEHLSRLRKTGRDEDALAALKQLGID